MQILYLIPRLTGGGAERQVAYLARGLTESGCTVHVGFVHPDPSTERWEANGAILHPLVVRGNHDPMLLFKILGLLRRLKPDLVQTWLTQMDVLGGIASKLTGTTWILSERSSADAYTKRWKDRLRFLIGRTSDAVVPNCAAGERLWMRQLGSSCAIRVIPNAVPLEEIEETRPIEGWDPDVGPDRKRILFVGRFTPEKNLGVLLLALKRVLARVDASVVFCGEGPLRGFVEGKAGELGISSRIELTGFRSDVWSWMKKADVLTAPSLFEGHPNVVLEAMACGCPLVVSDIPEHREFLDETSALLVAPSSAEDLAAALLSVLSDPSAARSRARRAAEIVRGYSLPGVARRYREFYCELLNGGPPSVAVRR